MGFLMRNGNSINLKTIIHNIFLVFFLHLFLNSSINAQSFNSKNYLGYEESSSITIGYGVFSSPKYEGGNDYTIRLAPFFNFKYKNLTVNPISGLKVNLLDKKTWEAGIGLGGSFGRYPKQNSYLYDLGNIKWTLETKIFAKYKTRLYSISSEIANDILQKGHKGYYLKTSLGTGFPVFNLTTFVRPSLSITFADANYLNSFFGVKENQSLSSGFSKYSIKNGIKDVSINLLLIYRLNDKVSLNGTFNYKKLMGNVAKSPIVQATDQFSTSFSIGYLY